MSLKYSVLFVLFVLLNFSLCQETSEIKEKCYLEFQREWRFVNYNCQKVFESDTLKFREDIMKDLDDADRACIMAEFEVNQIFESYYSMMVGYPGYPYFNEDWKLSETLFKIHHRNIKTKIRAKCNENSKRKELTNDEICEFLYFDKLDKIDNSKYKFQNQSTCTNSIVRKNIEKKFEQVTKSFNWNRSPFIHDNKEIMECLDQEEKKYQQFIYIVQRMRKDFKLSDDQLIALEDDIAKINELPSRVFSICVKNYYNNLEGFITTRSPNVRRY